MDDPGVVSDLERRGNLPGDRARRVGLNRALGDTVRQRLALDQLHDQRTDAVRVFEAVDLGDVG